MSYSFSVKAASKAEAIAKIKTELSAVVTGQPAHAADQGAAQAAAEALIGLLQDDPAQDVGATVSGSLWSTAAGLQQVSVSVNTGLQTRSKS